MPKTYDILGLGAQTLTVRQGFFVGLEGVNKNNGYNAWAPDSIVRYGKSMAYAVKPEADPPPAAAATPLGDQE